MLRYQGIAMGAWVLGSVALFACGSERAEPTQTGMTSKAATEKAGPGRGEDTESAGNNLSFPVIWSDGITLALRGAHGAPIFDGATAVVDGVTLYLQQDPLNEWQAESAVATEPLAVSLIDWGDNLEARPWTENSKVRVETVLYQNLATTMKGFEMAHVSGEGVTEMWGTTTTEYDSIQATVYSGCAQLGIQKILPPGEGAPQLSWNSALGKWEGDISEPYFNEGVFDAGDGPGFYSAEVNVSGKQIYGYNWDVKKTGDGPGTYRITFSLAAACGGKGTLNTSFDANTAIMISEPEEGEAETGSITAMEGEPVGETAHILPEFNLTYIDVMIVARGGDQGQGEGQGKGRRNDP